MEEKKISAEEKKISAEEKKIMEEKKISAEDQQLIDDIAMLDPALRAAALESIRSLIRSSTATMTSIPKALKYLRPHWNQLCQLFEQCGDGGLASVLSVMAMTMDSRGDCLKYRLACLDYDDLEDWGHEYLRHLAMELEQAKTQDGNLTLIERIAKFMLSHNAEPDAIDLLIATKQLDQVLPRVTLDAEQAARVCRYLISLQSYLDADDCDGQDLNGMVRMLSEKHCDWQQALICDLKSGLKGGDLKGGLNGLKGGDSNSSSTKRQADLFMAHHFGQLPWNHPSLLTQLGIEKIKETEDVYRTHQLDAMQLGGVLAAGGATAMRAMMATPRMNLVNLIVGGLINAGCGQDGLLTVDRVDEHAALKAEGADNATVKAEGADNKTEGAASKTGLLDLIAKCREPTQVAAIAAMGLTGLRRGEDLLERGLSEHLLSSAEGRQRAGALLALGMAHGGLAADGNDLCWALIREELEGLGQGASQVGHVGALLLGLGVAYAGTDRWDVCRESIEVHLSNGDGEVAAMAALSIALIAPGHPDAVSGLLQVMMERPLAKPWSHLHSLALCLHGHHNSDDIIIWQETLAAMAHGYGQEASILLDGIMALGTGAVWRMQEQLHALQQAMLNEKGETEVGEGEKGETEVGKELGESEVENEFGESKALDDEGKSEAKETQAKGEAKSDITDAKARVLTMGLIGMSGQDEVGREMAMRLFSQLMTSPGAHRVAVPMALAMAWVGTPSHAPVDCLLRWSHDHEKGVALSAIIALGLVGVGTNNARLAQSLRQLSAYYLRDSECLYAVRWAQAMVHAGRGVLTIGTWHAHRQLLHPRGLVCLLGLAMMATHSHSLWLDHYLPVAWISLGLTPRTLRCYLADDKEEELEEVAVLMRVGQALDTVGQAGRPKTITGFQTHSTPLLVGAGERAEMATEQWLPMGSILEGVVLVRPNPDYKP